MMSELYTKYVSDKTRAEAASDIVTAIHRGRLTGNEMKQLVEELKERGDLNDAKINRISNLQWDDYYLGRLRDEGVRGVFSYEYLLYLGEVAEYVRNKSLAKDKANTTKKWVTIGTVVAVIIIIWGVYKYFSK